MLHKNLRAVVFKVSIDGFSSPWCPMIGWRGMGQIQQAKTGAKGKFEDRRDAGVDASNLWRLRD